MLAWSVGPGFYAALLTATAIPMSLGYLIVTWSRRNDALLAQPPTTAHPNAGGVVPA